MIIAKGMPGNQTMDIRIKPSGPSRARKDARSVGKCPETCRELFDLAPLERGGREGG